MPRQVDAGGPQLIGWRGFRLPRVLRQGRHLAAQRLQQGCHSRCLRDPEATNVHFDAQLLHLLGTAEGVIGDLA